MKVLIIRLVTFERYKYKKYINIIYMTFHFIKKYTLCSIFGLIIVLSLTSCVDESNETSEQPPASDESFIPLVAYDMATGLQGDSFLGWRKSVYDDGQALSSGKSIKISISPGEPLPTCSGEHRFGGKALFPQGVVIPQGNTIWFRMMLYIPNTFSFGHKYSVGDNAEADACGQNADGNRWIKWMVMSPDVGTARIYLMPSGSRRIIEGGNEVRIISETLQAPGDFEIDLPRNEWFSLQVAVKVSSNEDGFIKAWLNDTFLGEVQGKNITSGASLKDWGLGDYWNGIPWTDGEAGRTDFWVDEIIIASDINGFGAPTTKDSQGNVYIASGVRVADFN
ncbi:heparin lyase I family protein [Aquimarina brevivitae]|uniref:Polysaccharide lyase-like protein n=1 Tax=Aquimarina brevivitae TaxID=323412 RepID=A0A4Q7P111_9FLAO|nr:heparin lyase I family protein [Aquimarina brevivitae]RZS93374.1 polysaccharide lyase-like protein [Aquimarina brevivitae]